MNTTRRKAHDDSDKAALNILVIDGNHFGRTLAEYLVESAQSVTFVSEDKPIDVGDGVGSLHRKLSNANDVQALASELTNIDLVVVGPESLLLGYLFRREFDPCDVVVGISNPANVPVFEGTGVDCINLPQIFAEEIRDRYT